MNFHFLAEVIALTASTSLIFLLFFSLAWAALLFAFAALRSPGAQYITVKKSILAKIPVIAIVLLFFYMSREFYRPQILIQMGFFILLAYLALYARHTEHLMRSGSGYVDTNTLSNAKETALLINDARDIFLGLSLGLFSASHWLDDGAVPAFFVAIVVLAVDTFAELRYGRGVALGESTKTRSRKFRLAVAHLLFGAIVGTLLGFFASDEPTIVAAVAGWMLVSLALLSRYLVIRQHRSSLYA